MRNADTDVTRLQTGDRARADARRGGIAIVRRRGPISKSDVFLLILGAFALLAGATSYVVEPRAASWTANAGWTASGLFALLAVAAAARGGGERVQTRSGRLLVAALACWLAAQLVWDAYSLTGRVLGTPSLADFFWLAFAGLALAAFQDWSEPARDHRWFTRLDLAAAFVGAGVITGLAFYDDAARSSLSAAGVATALAYPVVYGALALNLGHKLIEHWVLRRQPALMLALFGVLLEVIAFTLWTPELLEGTYAPGKDPIDILWTLGLVAVGGGALFTRSLAGAPELNERDLLRGAAAPGMAFIAVLAALPTLATGHSPLGQRLIAQSGAMLLGLVFALRFWLLSSRHLALARRERQASAEVRESAAELDRLYSLTPEMMCIAGFDGYFKRVSPHFERVLGHSPEDMLARPFLDFVHPDDRDATVAEVERLATGAMTLSFENRYRRNDGEYVWLRWNAAPSLEDGLIYAAANDVSARRRAETERENAQQEALRANAAKTEFLSRMSHELRTPLNSIIGFSQLLELSELEEEDLEAVGHILHAGRHLLDLINEVLDISRIEAGNLAISPEPVRLDAALADVLSLVRPLAEQRDVQLVTHLSDLGGRHVRADRQRLKQVLLNLLSNAIKYNRPEARTTVALEDAGDRMRVLVIDEGRGIADEELPRLFAPFDRLGAEAREIEGTGLGLALSKRLAELMGGDIHVTSVIGRGTTFTLELVTAAAPDADGRPSEELGLLTASAYLPPATILCIEDNPSNITLVERILGRAPHVRIVPAMLGELGISLAHDLLPDLILLDLHLPDVSGSEVLRALQHDQATHDIPVVILSADATPGQLERMCQAGATDYLTKPLDVGDFIEMVRHILTGRPNGDA